MVCQDAKQTTESAFAMAPLHIPRLLLRANETHRLYEEIGGATQCGRVQAMFATIRAVQQLWSSVYGGAFQLRGRNTPVLP